ncbi:MAG: DUF1643 domain-containing protein [Pseudomonadota bacterium]
MSVYFNVSGPSGAVISPCKEFRYRLWRVWDSTLFLMSVVMANPSTADADANDPTVTTLIKMAKRLGYGGLIVHNLSAYRATDPKDLAAAGYPVGKENYQYLEGARSIAEQNVQRIFFAWGNAANDGPLREVAEWMKSRCSLYEVQAFHFGLTKSGQPKHPLARGKRRIPNDQQPVPFSLGWVSRQTSNIKASIERESCD